MNTNNIIMWEILPSNADWDCFRILILREILKIQKSTSGGTLCVFGSHTFVPKSWMCKKQTAVSHSSTESEIISLDTAHTVKEQFAPEENRDIASFNTDNEFKRAIIRGHRLQHSRITTFCSETITWRQHSQFDSENREPSSATSTSK